MCVQPSVKGGRAHPFAFSVAARGGKEYIFAADQREDRDKVRWALSTAQSIEIGRASILYDL